MTRRRRLHAFALSIALLPIPAAAQPVSRSFSDLQTLIKPNEPVSVIDSRGEQWTGMAIRVSADSLTLSLAQPQPYGGMLWTPSGPAREFKPDNVVEVRRLDESKNPAAAIFRAGGLFGMGRSVKVGQKVEVLDQEGRLLHGKVLEVTPVSLVILTEANTRATFEPSGVRRIRREGPIWDGAVKGLATAATITLVVGRGYIWDYPRILLFNSAVGAGIGIAIDAAFGPATVYRGPRLARSVTLSPIVGPNRQGLSATIRF